MGDERYLEEKLRELERRSAEAGQPVTVQRRAALRALVRRLDHPTADAVYADVVGEVPGVSKATVCRALDKLVQLGLARRCTTKAPLLATTVTPSATTTSSATAAAASATWTGTCSTPSPRRESLRGPWRCATSS